MGEDAIVSVPTPLSCSPVLGAPARRAGRGYEHLQSTAANDSPVTTAQLKPKAFCSSSYFKAVLVFHTLTYLFLGAVKCKRRKGGTKINAEKESLLGK